jgi:hypothetical protein
MLGSRQTLCSLSRYRLREIASVPAGGAGQDGAAGSGPPNGAASSVQHRPARSMDRDTGEDGGCRSMWPRVHVDCAERQWVSVTVSVDGFGDSALIALFRFDR